MKFKSIITVWISTLIIGSLTAPVFNELSIAFFHSPESFGISDYPVTIVLFFFYALVLSTPTLLSLIMVSPIMRKYLNPRYCFYSSLLITMIGAIATISIFGESFYATAAAYAAASVAAFYIKSPSMADEIF